MIAFPVLVRRSVTVTRAFALARAALTTFPEIFRVAPGATAAFGGELIDRSFADGAAASEVPADSATTAPHVDRHASDLASRNDNLTSPLRCSTAVPTRRRFHDPEGNLLTVGRLVKYTPKA
ncbi:MAG TPA: hypothetical protein VI300_27365 [Solirubrobacter sp.]